MYSVFHRSTGFPDTTNFSRTMAPANIPSLLIAEANADSRRITENRKIGLGSGVGKGLGV